MNVYTRRSEIRWMLISLLILVPCIGFAIVKVTSAQGPLIDDPQAVAAEKQASEQAAEFAPCIKEAEAFRDEVKAFEDAAAAAKDAAVAQAKKDARFGQKPKPITSGDYDVAWDKVTPILKRARTLEKDCLRLANSAYPDAEKVLPTWKLVNKAGTSIEDPGEAKCEDKPDDKKGEEKKKCLAAHNEKQQVQRQRLEQYIADKDVSLKALIQHVTVASERLQANVAQTAAAVKDEKIRQTLPEGLLERNVAIGVGAGVALLALIVSYLSVHMASRRRLKTAEKLRQFADTPEAAAQTTGIVRLGMHANAGEPGMVIGAAIGALVVALLLKPEEDPTIVLGDMFVAGTMAGVVGGLVLQWIARAIVGTRWRLNAKEIGEIETPTMPVVLVTDGVKPAEEKAFLRDLKKLPFAEATAKVQDIATAAEERILMGGD